MFINLKKKLFSNVREPDLTPSSLPDNRSFKFYPATHVRFQSTVILLTEILECKTYDSTEKDTCIIRVKRDKGKDLFFEYDNWIECYKEFEIFLKLSTNPLGFITED